MFEAYLAFYSRLLDKNYSLKYAFLEPFYAAFSIKFNAFLTSWIDPETSTPQTRQETWKALKQYFDDSPHGAFENLVSLFETVIINTPQLEDNLPQQSKSHHMPQARFPALHFLSSLRAWIELDNFEAATSADFITNLRKEIWQQYRSNPNIPALAFLQTQTVPQQNSVTPTYAAAVRTFQPITPGAANPCYIPSFTKIHADFIAKIDSLQITSKLEANNYFDSLLQPPGFSPDAYQSLREICSQIMQTQQFISLPDNKLGLY
jgi:hypothetical protein